MRKPAGLSTGYSCVDGVSDAVTSDSPIGPREPVEFSSRRITAKELTSGLNRGNGLISHVDAPIIVGGQGRCGVTSTKSARSNYKKILQESSRCRLSCKINRILCGQSNPPPVRACPRGAARAVAHRIPDLHGYRLSRRESLRPHPRALAAVAGHRLTARVLVAHFRRFSVTKPPRHRAGLLHTGDIIWTGSSCTGRRAPTV